MTGPCSGIGIIAIVIAVIVVLRLWQGDSLLQDFDQQDEGQRVPLPDPRTSADVDKERVGFGAIRYADPHFDLDAFYDRVSEMFVAYHAAVERGDLKPARRFIDERYYSDLLKRMDSAKTGPRKASAPPAGGLTVVSARAMTATHEAGMDQVRVLINARSGASGAAFQEYWTLIRRQGAITKADLSLYKCPNCGAPTDGDDPTRCGYCGARLADPALDWVVTSIRND